jgi:hypothetical protein
MFEFIKKIGKNLFCICDLKEISTRYIEIQNHDKYEAESLYEFIYKCRKCGKVTSRFMEVEKRRYKGGKVKDYICQD